MVRREAGKPSKNPLKTLHDEGQTVWLDFLSRSFLAGDGLKRLIEHDGLTGVTSNPSIFEKAIAESVDYDASLRKAESDSDLGVMSIYERLAIDDIRRAADDLNPVFEQTRGADGYASIEVSPYLAMDTEATAPPIATAHRDLIVMLAARHKLCAVYNLRPFVTAGGLISYGTDIYDLYRRAAGYIDRVLKGEKPADLPVQAPTKF